MPDTSRRESVERQMATDPSGDASIGWLDREVRREKARVAELTEAMDKQVLALADQSERISGLEERLVRLQSQLVQMPEVHEAMQTTQTQVMGWLEEVKVDQRRREAAVEQQHRAEREHQSRLLHQIRDQLEQQAKLGDAVAAVREDIPHVREAVMRLREEASETERHVAQQDDRIAGLRIEIGHAEERLGKIEDVLKDLKQQQDGYSAQIVLIKDDVSKLEDDTEIIHDLRDELTEAQAQQAEAFRRAEVDRTKAMTDWGRKLEAYGQQQEAWSEQLRFFADQFERSRRTLREVQELSQQVSQQQDQLRQVQRLAEDQIRREAAEFRQEIERTVAKAVRQWELARDELLTADDAIERRVSELEASRVVDVKADDDLADEISLLRAALDRHAERVREAMIEVLDRQARATGSARDDVNVLMGRKEG
jgi:chromosome segregation ATPase